jgi:hypothetical protein
MRFPHSLGLPYSAFTWDCGFKHEGLWLSNPPSGLLSRVISDSLASLKSMIEICAEKIDFQIKKVRPTVNLSKNLQFLIAISTIHTKLISQTAIFNQSPWAKSN